MSNKNTDKENLNESVEKVDDTIEELDDSVVNFTKYIFGNKVKSENSIELKLEDANGINENLHIFQQLLQIFTDGFKFIHGNNNIVDKENINKENFNNMKPYFKSFGYKLIINVYNQSNFVRKVDLFRRQELINENTKLKDFYYQISIEIKKVPTIFRISFDKLN